MEDKMSDSWLPESDDAREAAIDEYRNATEGLDRDGNPFEIDDDSDEDE
jgi:hypothetical protein